MYNNNQYGGQPQQNQDPSIQKLLSQVRNCVNSQGIYASLKQNQAFENSFTDIFNQ